MKNLLLIFMLAISSLAFCNSNSEANKSIYFSRTKSYIIKYDENVWEMDTSENQWDCKFIDNTNLLFVYFSEYPFFIPKNKVKSTLIDHLKEQGKIKKIIISYRTINGMDVTYFEQYLKYEGYLYKYEGYFYNGNTGTIEIQCSGQVESMEVSKQKVQEILNGLSMVH